MNFLLKHGIANVVTAYAVQGLTRGLEFALIKMDPAAHAEYVEHVTELLDTKTAAFIARNEALVAKYANPETLNVNAEFKNIVDEILKMSKTKDNPNA